MITEILQSLKELGSTSSEIADNLLKQDCKGERGAAGMCPIANFIRRKHDVDPRVTHYYCILGEDPREIPLPETIGVFVRNFDKMLFPQLIK